MLNLGGKNRGQVPEPERPAQVESDAELIARACWVIKAAIDDREQTSYRGAPNVPLVDLCLDLRAVLVRSAAGKAVLRPHANVPVLVDPIQRLRTLLDAQRRAADKDLAAARAVAVQDVAELQAELAAAKTEREALVGENERLSDLVDRLSQFMPESWDGEDSLHSIVEEFVAVVTARLTALGGTVEKYEERADGSVFPDPRRDPNGYADAVAAARARLTCRCEAFGRGTPAHAPSFLCKPPVPVDDQRIPGAP